jgi:probable F420-dependent oxidoreductase
MKFGIVLPTFGSGATRLSILDTALAAERLGFDSVWVTDHLALPKADAERFGHIFEAISTLGYLAASTSQVRLGISTLVLPQRNPVEVAKEIATIDALSGGRVIFTAGIGWSQGEYANLGQNFKNRGRRMDEALKVLRTMWHGGPAISFQGDYYQFENVVLSPAPVQSGGPPLWVAGNSQAALRRAVHYGDGWHPTSISAEDVTKSLEQVQPLLGNRPFTICARLRIAFADQRDPQNILSGSVDQIRAGLHAYSQAGVNYAILYFPLESQGARERSMQLFKNEIMADWQD